MFEFSPAKQRCKNLKDFLVAVNTIEFEIFNTYKTVVFEELELTPEDRMWLRGVSSSLNFDSHFAFSPIGNRTMRDIPEYIALQLGYPAEQAKKFTGQSFKHSGATWSADSGASNMQITVLPTVADHKVPNGMGCQI